jgi:mannobiose 2-epimerase
MPNCKVNKEKFMSSVEKELTDDILKFWIENTVDNDFGGFYGEIDNDLNINKRASKGSVLYARILWAYSSAYRFYKKDEYLFMAKRAYEYIINYFWDNENSGVYWLVDYEGKPYDTKKQIYGQAFTIYALSEYYMATGDNESLERAKEIFNAIEKHSYDSENKGYFEAYSKDWKLLEDLRLSDKDMNEKKSMNTHLHVLEGYTNLFRIYKSKELEKRLKEIIEITLEFILDKNTNHFKLFFDEAWNSKVKTISYGHDIEGSWLLLEAAEVLGDKILLNKIKIISLDMSKAVLEQGIDTDGGLINELHENGEVDRDKHWWPQAEAVVGFLNAYQLSKDERYLEASYNMWNYIEENIIDKVNGEWFWMAKGEGNDHDKLPKVDMWKCPYHNSRTCHEVLKRLKSLNE